MDVNEILKELGAKIGNLEIENTVLRAELNEVKALLDSKEGNDNGNNNN